MHHDLVLLKRLTLHHVKMHPYHAHPTSLILIQQKERKSNLPMSPRKRTIFDEMALLTMKWSLILHQTSDFDSFFGLLT
jgi:hypothetical protein